jgi:dimethylpropiothetin dethiomethylase
VVKKNHKNNWYRLMAGLYLTYQSAYGAGSRQIDKHLEVVGERIKQVIHEPRLQLRQPADKPVVRHLKTALKMGEFFNESPVYHTIGMMAPCLTWEYGYDALPDTLADKYAYTEIIGPRGPIVYPHMILGMVLLGPDCYYPRHNHPEIEESYIGMAGYVSINNSTVLTTNSMTLIQAGYSHSMGTDKETPALLAFAWIGSKEALLRNQMHLDEAF